MEAENTPQVDLNPKTELTTLPDADSLRGKNCLLLFEFCPDENCPSFRKLSPQVILEILTQFTECLMEKWEKKDLEWVLIGVKDFRVNAAGKLHLGVPVLLQWSSSINLFTKPPPSIISHPTFNFRIKTIFAKSSHSPSQQNAFKDLFGIAEIYKYTDQCLVKVESSAVVMKKEKTRSKKQVLRQLTPKREEKNDNTLNQETESFSGMKRRLDKALKEKKRGEERIKVLTEENEMLTKQVVGYQKIIEEQGFKEVDTNNQFPSSQNQFSIFDSNRFSKVTFSRGKTQK